MLEPPNTSEYFTYKDYIQWDGPERWELIDGEATLMSAPSRQHQLVLVELVRQIANHLVGAECHVYVAPFDVRLPRGDEPDPEVDTVVQPDITVFCDQGRLDDAGARGAPDWVVEVASPSTGRRDRGIKKEVYERSGVHEYWIVDPPQSRLTIFRRDSRDAFGAPQVHAAPTSMGSATLASLTLDLSRIWGI